MNWTNGIKVASYSAIVLAAVAGCGLRDRRRAAPVLAGAAQPEAIEVGGLVSAGGRVPIPAGGLTLRTALQQAGGYAAPDAPLTSADTVLVVLSRKEATYHFALPLVTDGLAGTIHLAPSDRVSIQPWFATDLARGVLRKEAVAAQLADVDAPTEFDLPSLIKWSEKVTGEAIGPDDRDGILKASTLRKSLLNLVTVFLNNPKAAPAVQKIQVPKDIKAADVQSWVLTTYAPAMRLAYPKKDTTKSGWSNNWERLEALYADTKSPKQPEVLAKLVKGDHEVALNEFERKVRTPTFVTATGDKKFGAYHPNLSVTRATADTPHPDDGVLVLTRVVAGRNLVFVLKYRSTLPIDTMLLNSLLFSGDVVEYTLLARVPVVVSNLVAPFLMGNALNSLPRPGGPLAPGGVIEQVPAVSLSMPTLVNP